MGATLLAPSPARAEVSEKSTHPFEGHAFPPCNRPAATGPESFDAHYTVGREAFEHGDHAEALKQFAMAYDADCKRHEILVIISRAYEGDQNFADAARVLELYLSRVQDAPNAASIRERIAKLRERDRVRAQEDARARAAAQNARAQDTRTPKAATSGDEADPSPMPLVVAGIGGGLFVAGGVTMLLAVVSLPSGCNFGFPSHCDNPKDIPEAEKSRPATYVGVGLMGVGLATVAGGLVWHFLSRPTAPRSDAAKNSGFGIVPTIGVNYTGVTLKGSL